MVERIHAALEAFWADQVVAVDGIPGSVDDLVAAMDSMTAVEALMKVEEIVGMELPSGKVIRRGGYDSQAQFIKDLTTRVLRYVEEQSA
jgi:acyl carrier protein